MKERFNTFISANFAGICISTGAAILLSLDNKIVGSFLFAIGLFLVLTFSLNLFTGKICYA
ncbi:MAG: formate/nitrite transporter family protein, partial [Lachnospiraceae bacterium]|nr:formate/nitrite transporter family protein [Lachnospiraceae bacterium]